MICNHKLAEVYMSVQEHIPLEITTAKASSPKANLEEEIYLEKNTSCGKQCVFYFQLWKFFLLFCKAVRALN